VNLWRPYISFHAAALATSDVDPVYPVLAGVVAEWPREAAVRAVVAHLTWYHLGSALAVAANPGPLAVPAETVLPCATERRGNRDRRQLVRNVAGWNDAAQAAGGLAAYLLAGLPDDAVDAWRSVMARIAAIPGNGRWAAYKGAEMLREVVGAPLAITDAGHAFSSGPRHGLALLWGRIPQGNSAADVATLDDMTTATQLRLEQASLAAPVRQVETTLCDFHALWSGRYYVGHDIDAMQAQLDAVPSGLTDAAYRARAAHLPATYLGEMGGWAGVDRARCAVFRDRGQVVLR
jgi:hypothetical protein